MKGCRFLDGEEGVSFREHGVFVSNTFQNSFSTGKWKKYTVIENLQMELQVQGGFLITLVHGKLTEKKGKKQQVERTVRASREIWSEEPKTVTLSFGELASEGIFYVRLEALKKNSLLLGGAYVTEDLPATQPVKIAIDICTYRREPYVIRNMKLLREDILENPESPCYGKLWVHISDNGSTLGDSLGENPHITLEENANLGGVGGFTRGILETQKRQEKEGFTHVLIMDDDASISTAAIEVNYLLLSYLKPEYFGYTIGGKLMVLDAPQIQFEVGARWDRGEIQALKNGWDMRRPELVLESEVEEPVEYQGWWYCCIPLREIDPDNLPLPVFIHRDDIEYGMRTGKGRFLYLNQICIWHEAFAGKMPGALDYYDIRNLAITNAIQCEDYTRKEFKKFVTKWMWRNVAKYRYKYIDYNVKAVEDFCRGIDWLLATDGQELHRELMSMNYVAKPLCDFVGLPGFEEEELDTREEGYLNPLAPIRWYHKFTANGYFFPVKSHDVVVTAPYGSIHTLFRRDRTIVVDSFQKGIYLERDWKEFRRCYQKIKEVERLVEEKYEQAAQSYRERYAELTSRTFWEEYLGIAERD